MTGWKIDGERTTAILQGGPFKEKYYKDGKTGLWWSKDTTGHGGSAYKVYRENFTSLEWIADADKDGQFIPEKHKSDTGKSIPKKGCKNISIKKIRLFMINVPEEFIRLRNSEDPKEYNRAGVEEAPISVWFELIDNYPDMRVWVARNRTIPHEIIARLSKDDDPIVRDAICSKSTLDMDVFIMLAKDCDEGVRSRLTYNKKLPLSILKDMAENDTSSFVKSKALEKYKERVSKK